ncbi:MAG: hypothetical protein COZ46_06885 [Verrucomicrobia bacterium CG_4_10_14_3_um_filter_43_23]|nr:MAG: hypothetical protein AUJ82_05095 [Verrucomicrobia bacterium CG1_02_43_26]PIP59815.1 MAG: hypothetical protein COX01_01490 [Verrucomicrobia bacterium CG22_combo_CG10-13_8_21_14_all_43_17]PIX57827.1 MAG: hypothetical protein COZ46_06885 [Verrucomicrobia bacterium CG_4_10_14_3_um_filter_43_23]PIY63032.1 MAG: hypothetical protein COY94_00430 [Verrucomicrobia bacterium CG_4_10_14_0_8_um_filter_43_34]PJA43720.1 MAG: hypothetical protein CO175_06735 [Verrucomicrobia bacterium CG_4_9_14_3_um_fi
MMNEKLDQLMKAKEWFTAPEVANLIGSTDEFVRRAIEQKRILGHIFVSGKKRFYRVNKKHILLYLCETATYKNHDFQSKFLALIKGCPKDIQQEIMRALESNRPENISNN